MGSLFNEKPSTLCRVPVSFEKTVDASMLGFSNVTSKSSENVLFVGLSLESITNLKNLEGFVL